MHLGNNALSIVHHKTNTSIVSVIMATMSMYVAVGVAADSSDALYLMAI